MHSLLNRHTQRTQIHQNNSIQPVHLEANINGMEVWVRFMLEATNLDLFTKHAIGTTFCNNTLVVPTSGRNGTELVSFIGGLALSRR